MAGENTVGKFADLGERGGVDGEVSGYMESGEGEKEGGGEKSGVHRGDTFGTLRMGRERKRSARKHSICTEGERRKTKGRTFKQPTVHF